MHLQALFTIQLEHDTSAERPNHFPMDTRADAGDGSKVFEVNMALCGRGKARRSGRGKARTLSVDEAELLRTKPISASLARRQAAASKRQRRDSSMNENI